MTRGGSSGCAARDLPGGERDEQHYAGREEAHRRGRVPAVRRGVGEAVDQAEHPARHRCHARHVQPGARRLGLPAQQQHASGDPDRCEEQVDIQAPPPRQVGGQRAAEQQPQARAAGRDRAVDAEGLGPFLHVGECRGQQRQGGRRQQRGEDSLAGTRRHQHGEAARGAADGGGGREPGQPGHEGRLAADQVGQPPAEQQQAPERQRVRGHDPLPIGVGEPQRVLGRRQREIHHGHIEDDHERGSADGGEDQPPPWVGIASVAIAEAPGTSLCLLSHGLLTFRVPPGRYEHSGACHSGDVCRSHQGDERAAVRGTARVRNRGREGYGGAVPEFGSR